MRHHCSTTSSINHAILRADPVSSPRVVDLRRHLRPTALSSAQIRSPPLHRPPPPCPTPSTASHPGRASPLPSPPARPLFPQHPESQVDENFLLRTFARFGTIASGKIMWPRTEEERRRQRNCGFVAFTNRADGQAAKDEMQGVVVYDYELKIGWGKSVALPSQALPAPPGHMAIRNKEVASFVLS
ncbi:hypothetical protein BS78_09G093400 [Paspalum vaginatum]|nr:hypothetical protein BS78_09G093400 [Paspalum vaginatum]